MPNPMLTAASTLTCPHGATITAVASETAATADGTAPLHPTDTFTIAGCPFQIPAAPSPIPSPCIQVVWAVSDIAVTVGGKPTLSTASVGMCYGATGLLQGTVTISPGQTKTLSS